MAIDFTQYPSYSLYRTLRLTTPHQRGQDVYALQTALIAAGFPLPRFGADGDLGQETADAVIKAQRAFGLIADGLAGGKTQQALALKLAAVVTDTYSLPSGLVRGQIEHESSFRLGAYSAQRSDGSYDAGVTQRNTAHTPAKDGFTVQPSIDALGQRVRQYFDHFAGLPLRRRWELAQATWNAPAFACYIAREEGASAVKAGECLRPSAGQRATLEAYISSVSAYLNV